MPRSHSSHVAPSSLVGVPDTFRISPPRPACLSHHPRDELQNARRTALSCPQPGRQRCDDHRLRGESRRNPRCVSPVDRRAQTEEIRGGGRGGAGLQDNPLVLSKEKTGPKLGFLTAQSIILRISLSTY